MTTVLDIISRAFRKIGVKAEDESLTADQGQHGLDTLNAIFQGWALKGAATVPAIVAASDAFPLDAKYEEATAFILAGRLAVDYREPSPPDAERYERMVIGSLMVVAEAAMPKALYSTPSQRRLQGL